MDAERYSAERIAASHSSLFYATLFAERSKRQDLNALFALTAELRDVALTVSDSGVAAMKLQWWRDEIVRALEGVGEHPLAPALASLARDHDLPAAYFMEIADAVQMDLERPGYANLAELSLYLYRSGGVPAAIAATILGYGNAVTERFAQQLGFALRLVEIVRSLGADARQGRIYLPRERMDAFSVAPADLVASRTSDHLVRLLAELAGNARDHYRRALDLLPPPDRPRQRPVIIAGTLYMRLLDRMEAHGFQVIEQRFVLHPAHKLWLAWRTARREVRRARHQTVT